MLGNILYIEGCNFEDFPVGGQLTFAKQLLEVFGNKLFLVGIVTDEFPIGSWQKKNINDIEYNYFALFNASKTAKKPFLPRRLRVLLALLKHKKKIKQISADLVLTRSPEVIIPVSKWGYRKVCYYFAGTGNPLAISRRWYGRVLSGFYDRFFFPSLKKVNIILAAADTENINRTIVRSKGILEQGDIIQFPTRIDTTIFKKMDMNLCREKLKIEKDKTVITTTGRLHWAKGWKLMLDAFRIFLQQNENSVLYLIGDGNEKNSIINYINDNGLIPKVKLLGFQSHQNIAEYLNASDLFIMGSLMEGWATSLVEAKACGVPVCTTNFSSAHDIINHNTDGYVVERRDAKLFSEKMLDALNLKINPDLLEKEMQRYSLSALKNDFLKICNHEEISD